MRKKGSTKNHMRKYMAKIQEEKLFFKWEINIYSFLIA